jgi:GTPase SAR1 family protein
MYRENYIHSLRTELLEMVAQKLTPVALRYGYSEVPLETNIKWRPLVLVLGNYSSGKSTLINEFLGAEIQPSGQAPTDDSFTIITYDDTETPDSPIRITEERDGKFLLNDPEYPFETLKKHGQRFAAHFRLKKVNSPFLTNLAVIDTPGMLDSITERDRGYDYQEVIGDLAQIADLVLVLFDPHKAGTVREAHTSLRHTLPARTFEDRVLFVLNRIDECASMMDLLQVYGTLCWNLSQITGRKDIPMIHLTYSARAAAQSARNPDIDIGYLDHLENQREELKKAIMQAPCHRLDNLATFIETHGERLAHFLEALIGYRRRSRKFHLKLTLYGIFLALLAGGGILLGFLTMEPFAGMDAIIQIGTAIGAGAGFFLFWLTIIRKFLYARLFKKALANLDDLTPLGNQSRRDSWESIRDLVYVNLKETGGVYPLREVKQEFADMLKVHEKGSKEIREALKELAVLAPDEQPPANFLNRDSISMESVEKKTPGEPQPEE